MLPAADEIRSGQGCTNDRHPASHHDAHCKPRSVVILVSYRYALLVQPRQANIAGTRGYESYPLSAADPAVSFARYAAARRSTSGTGSA
jgi:hypothetical protein